MRAFPTARHGAARHGAPAAEADHPTARAHLPVDRDLASSYGGAIFSRSSAPSAGPNTGGGTFICERSRFVRCSAPGGGAGAVFLDIANASISDSVFTNCSAPGNFGGTVYTDRTNTQLRGLTITNGAAGVGARILVDRAQSFVLEDSVISGCRAGNVGGGVHLTGTNNLRIAQTTIDGCSAVVRGGGVSIESVASAALAGITVSGASAPTGSALYVAASTFTACNSVFGGQGVPVVKNGGTITIATSILSSAVDGGIATTDVIIGDPQLAPLANGVRGPLPGSRALDAGTATCVASYAMDQRGLPRVVGSAPDIGAVELQLAVSTAVQAFVNTPLVVGAPGVLVNASSGVVDDVFTVVNNTQPAIGTVAVAPSGAYNFTPAGNQFGTAVFTFVARNSEGLEYTAAVTIEIGVACALKE